MLSGLFCVIGDEHEMGGPGLAVEFTVESKAENELLLSTANDSNRLLEKFGIPQLTQCHDILFKTVYTGVDMCIQFAWYHF